MESERAFLNLRNLQSLKKINGNQEIKKSRKIAQDQETLISLKL